MSEYPNTCVIEVIRTSELVCPPDSKKDAVPIHRHVLYYSKDGELLADEGCDYGGCPQNE